MSFFDCVQSAMDDPEVAASRERGVRAQEQWREIADHYERMGYSRHEAEVRAGEDVKASWKREVGAKRHTWLATIANQRQTQLRVQQASPDELTRMASRTVEQIDMERRSLERAFKGRLGQFLRDHHPNLLQRITNPAQMKNILREMTGEGTGDVAAAALAKEVKNLIEEMRLMANEYGANIGKLDDYDVPHSHNRLEISRAGFDRWFKVIDAEDVLNWTRIENFATGRPFQAEGSGRPPEAMRRRFLAEIYDNIVGSEGAKDPKYGYKAGRPMHKSMSESRQLHFKSADAWMGYNARFGSGDPFSSLMHHVSSMAHDIAAMKNLSPNPDLGLAYLTDSIEARLRKEGKYREPMRVLGNLEISDAAHAKRMLRLFNGPAAPTGPLMEMSARFFASTRKILTSAFLDRAIVASISDMNTAKLTAEAIGLNAGNVLSTYTRTLADMVRNGTMATEDLLRHQWVMDTLADPGSAVARFQQEVPAIEVAEVLSSASMRLQGMNHHTDSLRFSMQAGIWGEWAKAAGKPLSDLHPGMQALLKSKGVTDEEWSLFARQENVYSAGNGATFLNPLYWRAGQEEAGGATNDLFLKLQSAVEEMTEVGVPTQSLYGKAFFDPSAFGLPAGSIAYEVLKSGTMFKSFVAAFTVNQIRMIAAKPTISSKIGYSLNLVAGATILGGMALQIGEIIKGNDPQPMDRPDFIMRAAMKGGGFGILGDIVTTGEASWGGGFGSYIAGPIPQLMDDAWSLTISNAIQLAMGKDTNFASELATAGKRYTPLGQTPLIGPSMDRMLWDQLQLYLDPQSAGDMQQKAQRRENLFGNDEYWRPGQMLPARAPDLTAILGG